MKRGILIASIGVAVLMISAIVLVATTQVSGDSTSKVECADSIVITFMGSTTVGGGAPSQQTQTDVTTYTTTTNSTATVSYTAVATITRPLLTGRAVTVHSCTYIK
jgi:hypothetical protein